jgi:hypothetical protein
MKKEKKVVGRPRKNEDEKLNHLVMVRFDEDSYLKFKKWCDDNCIIASAFIRRALENELKNKGITL